MARPRLSVDICPSMQDRGYLRTVLLNLHAGVKLHTSAQVKPRVCR